jgi:predicted lactoylglutathione lyase
VGAPVSVSLPVSDRRSSQDFYRAFLGLDAHGEPAADGVPEPLQFHVNAGFSLMLIPTGGFGWVMEGAGEVATRGTISALLNLAVSTSAGVDAVTGRVRAAGGTVVRTARLEEWGYCSLVADPDGHLWQVSVADG